MSVTQCFFYDPGLNIPTRLWDSGSTGTSCQASCTTVSQRHCRSEAEFSPANLEEPPTEIQDSHPLLYIRVSYDGDLYGSTSSTSSAVTVQKRSLDPEL